MSRTKFSTGFTFVEVAVIAPIAILLVASFIAVAINLTSQILISKAKNDLTYDIFNTQNMISEDIKQSTVFLAVNSIPLSADGSGNGNYQGLNNTGVASNTDTAAFNSIDSPSGSGNKIVLNINASTNNPVNQTSELAYISGAPNACGASQTANTPQSYNVVYFVSNNTLYRRVIFNTNYATNTCGAKASAATAAPFQRPTCASTYTVSFCKTNDTTLITNLSSLNLNIDYFQDGYTTTADANAVSSTLATRSQALADDNSANVTIAASRMVAGQTVTITGVMRTDRN